MNYVSNQINLFKKYLNNSINKINNFLKYSINLKTYEEFLITI